MTKDERDAIRRRCEATSIGPWIEDAKRDRQATPRMISSPVGSYPRFPTVTGLVAHCYGWNPEDATFIAHARQDVPALLAEVERLKAGILAAQAAIETEQKRMFSEGGGKIEEPRSIARFAGLGFVLTAIYGLGDDS